MHFYVYAARQRNLLTFTPFEQMGSTSEWLVILSHGFNVSQNLTEMLAGKFETGDPRFYHINTSLYIGSGRVVLEDNKRKGAL